MNKIDVFLNSIAQKHFQLETAELLALNPLDPSQADSEFECTCRLYAALLAAFNGGVRHAAALGGLAPEFLMRGVDIDLEQLEKQGRKRDSNREASSLTI